MLPLRRLPLFALLVALALGNWSAVSFAQAEKRPIVLDDFFTVSFPTEVQLSPDGSQVAYAQARWDVEADNRRTDLWVSSAKVKTNPKRLTFDRVNARQIRWGHDGKQIFCLANVKRAAETAPPYDGSAQIWRIATDGGELVPITRVKGGVGSFDTNGSWIYYTVTVKKSEQDDFAKLRSRFGQVEYGHGIHNVSELYLLRLNDMRPEKVAAPGRYIRELAVDPQGSKVAMITAYDDSVIKSEGESRVDVWDFFSREIETTDQSWRETAGSPYPWLASLCWAPDSKSLAYSTAFDAYPAEVIVNQKTEQGWKASRMPRNGVTLHGYGSPLGWVDDNTLIAVFDIDGDAIAYRYSIGDDPAPYGEGAGVIWSLHASPQGVVSIRGTPEGFPEVTLHAPGQEPKPITDLNGQTRSWQLPKIRHVEWKAPDGSRVGGVLELPHNAKDGEKLPLIVAIHGGPTTASRTELNFSSHNGRLYFAANGYAVLCPNYRGSSGYGDKFLTDLVGHANDIEVKDILAGIQHLIDEGIADPDRIGVMGWSNGGYLTNCLITLKDPPVKIRAASSGAGIMDAIAEWGFNDEPAYPMAFYKGLPWQTPELYHKASPTYGLGNVTTPTLIHVGGNDVRCPPGHSQMLYRSLKEYLNVPTEYIVYTGEPHGLTKAANNRAKMEWDLAWFEKYLAPSK